MSRPHYGRWGYVKNIISSNGKRSPHQNLAGGRVNLLPGNSWNQIREPFCCGVGHMYRSHYRN